MSKKMQPSLHFKEVAQGHTAGKRLIREVTWVLYCQVHNYFHRTSGLSLLGLPQWNTTDGVA